MWHLICNNIDSGEVLYELLKLQVIYLSKLIISLSKQKKTKIYIKKLKKTRINVNAGAWIITGGFHAGVVKHVGKGIRDYTANEALDNPVNAIGIASWGRVWNRDNLCQVVVD